MVLAEPAKCHGCKISVSCMVDVVLGTSANLHLIESVLIAGVMILVGCTNPPKKNALAPKKVRNWPGTGNTISMTMNGLMLGRVLGSNVSRTPRVSDKEVMLIWWCKVSKYK